MSVFTKLSAAVNALLFGQDAVELGFKAVYTRNSGLAVFDSQVGSQETPLALVFNDPNDDSCVLFTSDEQRDGQPTWQTLSIPQATFESETLDFGIVAFTFAFKKDTFSEVAGFLSLTRNSPILNGRRGVSLRYDNPLNRKYVTVTIFSGEVDGTKNWRTADDEITIPLIEGDNMWKFETERKDLKNGKVAAIIDPSSRDILLPKQLYSLLFSSAKIKQENGGSHAFKINESGRLYVPVDDKDNASMFYLKKFLRGLYIPGDFSGNPFGSLLSSSSLEYHTMEGIRSISGWKPVRVRFVQDLDHVVFGQPFIHNYADVVLDNVGEKIHLYTRQDRPDDADSMPAERPEPPPLFDPNNGTGESTFPLLAKISRLVTGAKQ